MNILSFLYIICASNINDLLLLISDTINNLLLLLHIYNIMLYLNRK